MMSLSKGGVGLQRKAEPGFAQAFPPRDILVMAPHADDDILGCGHLMQRVSTAGGRVVIVWLTDGGGSHGALKPAARQALVVRREREALAGVHALGVQPTATYFLGFKDGYLADAEDAARVRLETVRRHHALATGVVTAADDGHPDHRAAFRIAVCLGLERLYSYPISARYDGAGYTPPVDALRHPYGIADSKRRALLQHRSQAPGAGAIHPMSDRAIDQFCRDPEIFIPVQMLS